MAKGLNLLLTTKLVPASLRASCSIRKGWIRCPTNSSAKSCRGRKLRFAQGPDRSLNAVDDVTGVSRSGPGRSRR